MKWIANLLKDGIKAFIRQGAIAFVSTVACGICAAIASALA